jgi:large repetitive protein
VKRHRAFVFNLFGFLLCFNLSAVLAQAVDIDYTSRGWYDQTGFRWPNNLNYLVGYNGNTYRDFFVFDLSGVSQPIASAKLALYVPSATVHGYDSPDPSENYELHDVDTPVAALIAGASTSAFDDLGSGLVYGSRSVAAADQDSVIEIPLNFSAIAAINATHGLFAIGGSLTTITGNPLHHEFVFGNSDSDGDGTTGLRLTFVPEPTSATLVGCAAMICGMQRSRKRSI